MDQKELTAKFHFAQELTDQWMDHLDIPAILINNFYQLQNTLMHQLLVENMKQLVVSIIFLIQMKRSQF